MQKRTSTTGVVVHHTAGNESSAAALRGVFRSRFGVDYIGYHRVIAKDGSVWGDLALDDVGIHNNKGTVNNMNSIGVSLVGNFEIERPTEAQLKTLKVLLRQFKTEFPTIKREKIVGHRDMAPTACPGKNFYPMLPGIINEVYQTNQPPQEEDMGRIEELEAIVRDVRAENNDLKRDRDAKIDEVANLKTDVAKLSTDYQASQRLVESLTADVSRLKDQLATQPAACPPERVVSSFSASELFNALISKLFGGNK